MRTSAALSSTHRDGLIGQKRIDARSGAPNRRPPQPQPISTQRHRVRRGGAPARYIHRGGERSATVERLQRGGAANGPRHAPFDRWFRYPAGFSPAALEVALEAASLKPGDLVVDPFAGAATGWRAGVARGYRYVGLEAHPEIAELAQLKMRHLERPRRIVEHAEQLVRDIEEADISGETELVRRSFEADSLQKFVSIRDQLKALPRKTTNRYLKWSLLGALRDSATVQVRWPYQRPAVHRRPRIADPVRAFLRRAEWMATDLEEALGHTRSAVLRGDARRSADWVRILGDQRASAVITSPPYLNNFDYADATRLELYFWGVATTWSEMVARVRAGMLTATTQQTRKDRTRKAMTRLGSLAPATTSALAPLIIKLETERHARARGKEYDRVIGPYFEGMTRVLTNVLKSAQRGALIVLVIGDSAPYGVYIDTPALLAQLAQELGFELLELKNIRHRGTRWRNNSTRHQHPLSEQLLVLRRPCR